VPLMRDAQRKTTNSEESRSQLRNRVYCSTCGTSAPRRVGMAPLGWQEMPGRNGRTLALCPECLRQNLWLIEARLEIGDEWP
jgi:hypothetical protein